MGGGLGRTPMIGKTLREFLPKDELLAYLEATLRVYNRYGRRDNLYKARIKILVHEIGAEKMREEVEAEYAEIKDGALKLPAETIEAIARQFAPPALPHRPAVAGAVEALKLEDRDFALWLKSNVSPHRLAGYRIVTASLKPAGAPPGDASSRADGRRRRHRRRLQPGRDPGEPRAEPGAAACRGRGPAGGLAGARPAGLRRGQCRQDHRHHRLPGPRLLRAGQCALDPGGAAHLHALRASSARQHDIGDLKIKISGCINACGHHHVGHIGILGVDKNGVELYQISLGGDVDFGKTALGTILGPAVTADKVVEAVDALVATYLDARGEGERFVDTYRRIGAQPFKERVYAVV